MSIDLVGIKWFTSGNDYTGSLGNFQYKVVPHDGVLTATVWRGALCSEKTPAQNTAEFELSLGGLDQTIAWLEEQRDCLSKTEPD